MAKKTYKDEYYEKLERISTLKKSGDITEQEFAEEKKKLDDKKATHENPPSNIAVAIVLILIAVFVIWIFTRGSGDAQTPPDLNIKAGMDNQGILVTNNEQGTLAGCKLTLNDEYTLKADAINAEERTYPYSSFTKADGTRFNVIETKPSTLLVSNCDGEQNRLTSFNW